MTITISQIESLQASISSALGVLEEIDGFVTQVKTTPVVPAVPESNLLTLMEQLGSFFSKMEALGTKVRALPVVPANPPPASPAA